jgi:ubiquitin-protein ligase
MNTSNSKATMRLKNEFTALSEDSVCNSTVLLENEESLFNWIVMMQGPDSTPYEGGIFRLTFKFPDNYPFKAPEVKFLTTTYHPNIKFDTGEICQDVFASDWAPTQKVQDILEKIVTMLREPSTSTPLENDICNLYLTNRNEFNKNARANTEKYAN